MKAHYSIRSSDIFYYQHLVFLAMHFDFDKPMMTISRSRREFISNLNPFHFLIFLFRKKRKGAFWWGNSPQKDTDVMS